MKKLFFTLTLVAAIAACTTNTTETSLVDSTLTVDTTLVQDSTTADSITTDSSAI